MKTNKKDQLKEQAKQDLKEELNRLLADHHNAWNGQLKISSTAMQKLQKQVIQEVTLTF